MLASFVTYKQEMCKRACLQWYELQRNRKQTALPYLKLALINFRSNSFVLQVKIATSGIDVDYSVILMWFEMETESVSKRNGTSDALQHTLNRIETSTRKHYS